MKLKEALIGGAILAGGALAIIYGTFGICIWLVQHGFGA